ncbi:MAG: quinone oxidoreductase family protein [Candidatus Kariarchaeaceae archaeon]|jgi:NADPH2:quinone reductase
MKAVVLNKTGGPNVLQVTEVDDPTPKRDEVLVQTKFSGVNYADLLSRQGLYSWSAKRPFILGFELAGVVEEVGKGVTSFQEGERVIVGAQNGGYAEKIARHEKFVFPAPEQFTFEESAAFFANWFTVWLALHETARVRKNEILLVHAAAGGVGTAAVKLGIAHGMKVYGTASTKKKQDFIEEMGGIALTYDNFDTELIQNKPDCIIETIGGDVFKRGFEILAPTGRIVLVGASGIQVNKWNPISWFKAWRSIPRTKMSKVLRRSRGFMGVHVGYLAGYYDRFRPSWDELIKVVTDHDFRPIIPKDQIFPMSKVTDAHQLIHDRKNIGKVLLDPSK